jgi:hypothetical protein
MRKVLSDNAPPVKPSSVVPYFDCIRLWLRSPVSARVIKKLRRLCGHLDTANKSGRWNRDFRQRLTFFQPNDDALRWIAARRGGLVNHVQFTLDLLYNTRAAAAATRGYLDRHRVRRWHRRSQGVNHYHDDDSLTRYDAPPNARNNVTDYLEQTSRITGQENCLHIEWRAEGQEAVRAAGISTPRHLLTFDHRSFWKHRLRLYTVEPGRLGRLFNNRQEKTRRHDITEADHRLGRRLMCWGDTTQDFLDLFGSHRISHVLIALDTEPFLPPQRSSLYQLSLTDRNHDNSPSTRNPLPVAISAPRKAPISITGRKNRSGVSPVTISGRMNSRTDYPRGSSLSNAKED